MRQIVSLQTVDQWFAQSEQVRYEILRNIRLKDRLANWMEREIAKPKSTRIEWHECQSCKDTVVDGVKYPGWVLHRPRLPGIHPSQLSHSCMLRLYWEMEGRESREKFDFRQQLIFGLGTAVHRMFQSYGVRGAWGERYQPEATVGPEFQEIAERYMIQGSADADNILVMDDLPSSDTIYEVGIIHEYKTIKAENFKKLTGPKAEHKQQAMVYSAALDRPVTVYIYLNKNDSNIVEYPVAFDRQLWDALQEKTSRLNEFYDADQAPPANVGYHCAECGFGYACQAYQASRGREIGR